LHVVGIEKNGMMDLFNEFGSEQESVRTGDFTVLRDLGAIR